MKGQYWQVREKVFDYEGRFRRAMNYAVNRTLIDVPAV
jgi:hypothetical protein